MKKAFCKCLSLYIIQLKPNLETGCLKFNQISDIYSITGFDLCVLYWMLLLQGNVFVKFTHKTLGDEGKYAELFQKLKN